MIEDQSNGYDAIAADYIKARSAVGEAFIRGWAASLPRGGRVVDLGAGDGKPVTAALVEAGLGVSAIDASPAMVGLLQRNFPRIEIACEAAEHSRFFDRNFDGAVAIGLVFLLREDCQTQLIMRVGKALAPDGRFLFSAPRQICAWDDLLTGRRSVSLGRIAYKRALEQAGFHLIAEHEDEGGNHYFDAQKS